MPSIILPCPHCGAESVGFYIASDRMRPSTVNSYHVPHRVWDDLAICTKCEHAVIVVYALSESDVARQSSPAQCPSDPENWGFKLIDVLPRPRPSRAPEHLPDPLPNIFVQAANALKRGDWDASGAMSRKTLDVSTKLLMKDAAKPVGNLGPRIDALAKQGKLTEDLQQWAHHIRMDGNDASHDEDPFTKDEAEELLDFTELFLTYVFTLPGRMKDKMKSPP